MKKIILIAVSIYVTSNFCVVWEQDPTFTPEQRAQAKATNERIRNRNREREVAMHKEIAAATEKFIQEIEAIKAKYPSIIG